MEVEQNWSVESFASSLRRHSDCDDSEWIDAITQHLDLRQISYDTVKVDSSVVVIVRQSRYVPDEDIDLLKRLSSHLDERVTFVFED